MRPFQKVRQRDAELQVVLPASEPYCLVWQRCDSVRNPEIAKIKSFPKTTCNNQIRSAQNEILDVIIRTATLFCALPTVPACVGACAVTISLRANTAFGVFARATAFASIPGDLIPRSFSFRQIQSRTMASWAPQMFGDVLIAADGTEHDTTTKLAGKTTGIYFSAHWCPPCRQFTPIFAETYGKLRDELGKDFEVVFVSSDRDEKSFDEYLGEMPWLALPYAARDLKAKLSQKFKVNGIPALIIVDENGELITKDGRKDIVATPEKFPWTPPSISEVLGDTFIRNKADGTTESVTLESLKSANKNIGVYFSAHWCGPCRQFTPKLKELYEQLQKEGKPFEVIFVSSDRSQAEFDEYRSESMPEWLTVPYDDTARRQQLSEHFQVQGIPHFAMLGSDLKIINKSARGSVTGDPTGAKFPWPPPLVVDVDSEEMGGGINDTPTVVVLMEECGEVWDEMNVSLEVVAKKTRAKEIESGQENRNVLFVTVTETGGGVGGQLRKLVKLGRAGAEPQMILLDLAEGGYVLSEDKVTTESIEQLVNDFTAGKLALTKA